jgi:hypothetical protein
MDRPGPGPAATGQWRLPVHGGQAAEQREQSRHVVGRHGQPGLFTLSQARAVVEPGGERAVDKGIDEGAVNGSTASRVRSG